MLLELDGAMLAGTDDLLRLLTGQRVGRSLEVTVLRQGERVRLAVQPRERLPRAA